MSALTPKQLKALSGISQGLPPNQIAKRLGISTRSLQRWQKLPEFVAALTQVQNEVSRKVKVDAVESVTSVNSRLEVLASKSFDALEQILDNPESRGSDRLQAAKIVLTEWQRTQPPVMHELQALESLIKAGYLSNAHVEKMREAVDLLTSQCRTILHEPT